MRTSAVQHPDHGRECDDVADPSHGNAGHPHRGRHGNLAECSERNRHPASTPSAGRAAVGGLDWYEERHRTRDSFDKRILKPQQMSAKLTTAKIHEFEAHIKKRYEGVVFELMVMHNLLVRNAIELTWIIVEDRKKGVGTAIMRELCEFADHHAVEIRLKTASKGDHVATTSRARLIRFYKRFGFVGDKGEPGEITGILGLIRQPVI